MKTRKRATTGVQQRVFFKARQNVWCGTGGVFTSPSHEAVSKGLQYMAQNFMRPILLEEVVRVTRMSRRGFISAFNKNTGRTPISVLRQMRIEYAKQLLVEQDLPLKMIASLTGFRSENTFCVAFQRAVNMAPKKYQRHVWLAERRGRSKLNIPFLQPLTSSQHNQYTASNNL